MLKAKGIIFGLLERSASARFNRINENLFDPHRRFLSSERNKDEITNHQSDEGNKARDHKIWMRLQHIVQQPSHNDEKVRGWEFFVLVLWPWIRGILKAKSLWNCGGTFDQIANFEKKVDIKKKEISLLEVNIWLPDDVKLKSFIYLLKQQHSDSRGAA